MKTIFSNKRLLAVTSLLIGMLGILSFVFVLYKWSLDSSFFLKYPGIHIISGPNVVSKAANFLYLTYQSVIFNSLWLILFSISLFFDIHGLYHFLVKKSLISFITALGMMIAIFYGSYQLFAGIFYGLNDPSNVIDPAFVFVTSLFHHLILPLIMLVFYFNIKLEGKIKFYNYFSYSIYGFIYILIVTIVGKFAFNNLEWYPYPLFEVSTFAKAFFINSTPFGFQYFMLILVQIFCIFSLSAFIFILDKIRTKRILSERKIFIEDSSLEEIYHKGKI